MEIFKPIPGYNDYLASNTGKIKSTKFWKEKILKPIKNNWYLTFTITVEGKQKRLFWHRLVAAAFLENPHNKPEVNHINGIKNDNNINNLEWATSKENLKHSRYTLWNKLHGKTKKYYQKQELQNILGIHLKTGRSLQNIIKQRLRELT